MSSLLERTLARRTALVVALILVLGALLTAWSVLQVQAANEARVRREFEGHVERLQRQVITRIERAEYGLLGLRGAMLLHPAMSPAEFTELVGSRDMWRDFRGIRGFGLIEQVPRSQLDAFTVRQRQAGSPHFRVETRGHAPDLFVVRAIEPLAANRSALGYDLGSDPMRREAINRALETGQATLSGRVTLRQGTSNSPGWAYLLPVYERKGGPGRREEGPGRLVGLLQAPIVAKEMLGNLSQFVDFMVDFRLYDGAPEEGRPMVDSQSELDASLMSPPDASYAARWLREERTFAVGGRTLTLQVAARPALVAAVAAPLRPSVLVGLGGTLGTLLLAVAAWQMMRGRSQALLLAHRMTADLERTSADLARSNQRLQAVMDNLPCGLSVFDGKMNLLSHNALLRRQLGLDDGQEGAARLPQAALAHLHEAQPDHVGTPAWPLREPRRFERSLPDGTHLEIHAGPMPDGGLVLTYVDATARHEAEAALRASEALMRLVTDSIPGRIAYWDREGVCRFANSEFRAARGVDGAPVVGAHWQVVYGDSADHPQRPQRVAAVLGGQHQTFERTEVEADGREHTRLLHYIPHLADGQVQGYFAIGLDITEIREARDDALRASQAKTRFVANMSHEMRTPMNAVLGMLQLLQHTQLTSQQEDYVGKAEGAARALLSVLDDILDFSKVEAGKMVLDPREFEVDAMLRDLSVIFATALGNRPVDFHFELHPELPPRLVGDDMRLRQILINLGGNAIKFTDRGRVALAIEPVDRRGDTVTVEISVSDTGIGIAPEQLRQLFQDFGQAEASTTRRFGGTGLGLAISRRLVALMGGELVVHSEYGKGSRFSFRLDLPLGRRTAVAPLSAGPAPCVLLADCNAARRQAHAAMGRRLGWQVQEAGGTEEAVALVVDGAQRYDALFVDWYMDREAALDSARALGQLLEGRGTRLVVMGAGEMQGLLARLEPARQRHIGASLTRPFTPRMMAQALADSRRPVLQRGQAGRPSQAAPALAGMRLLVAEDNPNNQMVARELLTRQGARVEIAGDGLEAIDRVVNAGPYDAVLMDWQMPNMDGLQATRTLRAMAGFARLPIIAVTANAMESDRQECLAAGMTAHVAKPLQLRELVSTLLAHAGPGTRSLVRPPSGPLLPTPQVRLQAPPAVQAAPGLPPDGAQQEVLVDRAGAVEGLGGDEGLYAQLVPLFRDEAPRMLVQLRQACSAGVRQDAARVAHTLKGTAGTVGAGHLARVCKETEKTLAGDASPQDEVAIEALRVAIDRTLEALAD